MISVEGQRWNTNEDMPMTKPKLQSPDQPTLPTDAASKIPMALLVKQPAARKDIWESERSRLTIALLSVPLLAMILLFMLPLLIVLWMSFAGSNFDGLSLDAYGSLLQPVYIRLLWSTLQLAFFVTLLTGLLGYPLAYLMVSQGGSFAKWMAITLFISLWLSFLGKTFSWIVILQRNGVVNKLLMASGVVDRPLELVYNQVGVYIGMVHVLLPFMVVMLVPALKAIDPVYMRTALSLGARPFKVFWQIYFPMSLPGVVAGSMLVFTLAIGFFVTPAILGGGRVPTIVLAIRDQVQELGDLRMASAMSVVLLVICLAMLLAYDRITGVDRIFDNGRS